MSTPTVTVTKPLEQDQNGVATGSVQLHVQHRETPFVIDMTLERDPDPMKRFRLIDLRLQAGPGRGISATDIRITTGAYVQMATEALLEPMPVLEALRFPGPTPEALKAVMETYEVAQRYGKPPAQAVRRRLGLSHATATRWIARARHELLLS